MEFVSRWRAIKAHDSRRKHEREKRARSAKELSDAESPQPQNERAAAYEVVLRWRMEGRRRRRSRTGEVVTGGRHRRQFTAGRETRRRGHAHVLAIRHVDRSRIMVRAIGNGGRWGDRRMLVRMTAVVTMVLVPGMSMRICDRWLVGST